MGRPAQDIFKLAVYHMYKTYESNGRPKGKERPESPNDR